MMTRADIPGRLTLCLLAAALLAACTDVQEGFERIITPDDVAARGIAYQQGQPPIYCYATLARPDCYATPQPGPPNRLIQAYPDQR